MSWTEEKIAKLKELWGKGNTASQIAEIIGGITRNAVIGKAHRLNLSAKIKTRAAASNKNIENLQVKNIAPKRGRRSKFSSLIIEKKKRLQKKMKFQNLLKKKFSLLNKHNQLSVSFLELYLSVENCPPSLHI